MDHIVQQGDRIVRCSIYRWLGELLVVSVFGACLTSCTSAPKSPLVMGKGTDVRDVGRGLAEKFISDRWLDEFQAANGRVPQVRVGQLKVAPDMNTDRNLLIGTFQEELRNSKRGIFLAERADLDEGNIEKEDDAGRDPTQASKKSARKKADYLMKGEFTHQRDSATDVIYTAKFWLQDPETEEIFVKNCYVVYKNGKRVE